ncbi:MAG: hypothetical protein R3B93_11300 [Bacteroidia bacterium]
MKKLIAFLPAILFFFHLFGQCPTGNLLLSTQAEIDNFPINYPNCTSTFNSLEINGNSITNLQGLSSLQTVGDLTIKNNPNLTSLSGLDNLQSTFVFLFRNNDSISDFSGLENLTFATDIIVEYNNSLTSLQGLNNVQGTFILDINSNPSLTGIDAFLDSLKSAMQVIIRANPLITNLNGLEVTLA